MSTEPDPKPRESRVKEIFMRAWELESAEERRRYLEQACGEDRELRQTVESLLEAHEKSGTFLSRDVSGEELDCPDEGPGTVIGRYRLLERLGEGGFGEVYLAEQTGPVKRQVALKIIKAGMDSKEVIARFEVERQALALMNHPNIARVLDAGTTGADKSKFKNQNSKIDTGRPYFVMELACGEPITKYCDSHRLPLAERLNLFQQVCGAVQHAHQKGIIHRDLKPSNIVVTQEDPDASGVPKIIDFGIAKSLQGRLTDRTLVTRREVLLGTPAYMSPEQMEQTSEDLDTRTDIYSLGVLLYELVAGVTPFDGDTLRRAALVEVQRIIREVEPPKPSTRVHTLGTKATEIAERRNIEPLMFERTLRGDLDWIVMKAIEKDRGRRYESAAELSNDLQRHLHHEPVHAGPPSTTYRARKFVRRHRMGVALAASVTTALIAGLLVSLMGFMQARQDRYRAKAAESLAQKQLNLTRQSLYFAHIREAHQDWQSGQITRMLRTLRQYIPAEGEPDLRGWEWYYLLSLCHREKRTLTGHTGGVAAVSCHPNGRWFASGGRDRIVRIWDVESGEALAELNGHSREVTSVAWSPDGAKLASGGHDGKMILWDAKTFQKLATLDCDQDVLAIAWSPDGKKVAAGGIGSFSSSEDGLVTIWDAASHQRLHYLWGEGGMIRSLAWHPAGRLLVAAEGGHGWIQAWEANSGQLLKTIQAHGHYVCGLAWGPDGHRLASASYDQRIRVWDPETWDMVGEMEPAHAGTVQALAWSPDGQVLVSGGRDGLVRLWNPQTGSCLNLLRGHQGPVSSVCWWPQRGLVLSGSLDGTMKIWSPEREQAADALPGSAPLAWSPDGQQIAVDGSRRNWNGRAFIIAVLDAATRRLLYGLEYPSNMPRYSPFGVAWSPDSRRMAVGFAEPDAGRMFQVWDLAARKLILTVARTNEVRSVAWSPDGRLLLVACWGGAYIFRPEAKECVLTFREHGLSLCSAAWHPDGQRIASKDAEGGILIWDATTGRILRRLQDADGWGVNAGHQIAWSPHGDWLAAGGGNGVVMVWDGETGRVIHTLRGHTSNVRSVSWSPSGRRLASVAEDRTLRIWDARSGQELLVLPTPQQNTYPCVDWSPDGRRIATACSVVRIFDATIGYEWAAKMASEGHDE